MKSYLNCHDQFAARVKASFEKTKTEAEKQEEMQAQAAYLMDG